jgi:hypothetical protein
MAPVKAAGVASAPPMTTEEDVRKRKPVKGAPAFQPAENSLKIAATAIDAREATWCVSITDSVA